MKRVIRVHAVSAGSLATVAHQLNVAHQLTVLWQSYSDTRVLFDTTGLWESAGSLALALCIVGSFGLHTVRIIRERAHARHVKATDSAK